MEVNKEIKIIKKIKKKNHRSVKNKKLEKIMEKFNENHLSFFTKKENKENQTDF